MLVFSQEFDKESNKNISPSPKKKKKKVSWFAGLLALNLFYLHFRNHAADILRRPDVFKNSEEKKNISHEFLVLEAEERRHSSFLSESLESCGNATNHAE